jgi:anti-sigma B factor antagonist
VEIQVEQGKGFVTLQLNGKLERASTGTLKNKVAELLKADYSNLIIDMAEVRSVDSSGLGSLVAILRTVTRHGGDVRIVQLQESVRAVFRLVRLENVFEICGTVEEAAETF